MAGKELTTITLSDKRVLTISDVDPGDMFTICECMTEGGNTRLWLFYATSVFAVTKIDGRPLPTPNTNEKIKQRARDIGGEGLAKVQDFMAEQTGKRLAEVEEGTPKLSDVEIGAKN